MEAYAIDELRRADKAVRSRRRGVFAAVTVTKKDAGKKAGGKTPAAAPPKKADLGAVLKKASASAFRGGMAGFAAGVVQARGRRCVEASLSDVNASSLSPGRLLHVDAHRDELPGAQCSQL